MDTETPSKGADKKPLTLSERTGKVIDRILGKREFDRGQEVRK